jgi:predicted RNase H-like HicB family nuclease
MKMQYSILIQWSDEDDAFLVTIPEFGASPQTHGDTYKEAFKRALQVMESLVEFHEAEGQALPKPKKYTDKKTVKVSKKQAVA